jgi:hypothetical protein
MDSMNTRHCLNIFYFSPITFHFSLFYSQIFWRVMYVNG